MYITYSSIVERLPHKTNVVLVNLGLDEDKIIRTLTVTKEVEKSGKFEIKWGEPTTYILLDPIKFDNNIKTRSFNNNEFTKILTNLLIFGGYTIDDYKDLPYLLEKLYERNLIRKVITDIDESL